MVRIPSQNRSVPSAADDASFQDESVAREIVNRFVLSMGGVSGSSTTSHGIVWPTEPRGEDSTLPLFVTVNDSNALKVNASAGTVVTKEGGLLTVASGATGLALASVEIGSSTVIFVEYDVPLTEDPALQGTTRSGVVTGRRYVMTVDENAYHALLLSDYLALSADRLNAIVPIAVVTVSQTEAGAKELLIDQTTTTYAWNRPWFSIVDHQHRAKVGSGTSTDANPHGTALSDLSDGSLTLYQMMLRVGGVVAKDYDVDRVAGTLCRETITADRIVSDSTGSVTGVPGAKYVRLLDFPLHLGRCTDAEVQAPATVTNPRDYAPTLIPRSNIVWFHPLDVLNETCDQWIWYTSAGSAVSVDPTEYDVLSVSPLASDREILISQGKAVSALSDQYVDLRCYRGVPLIVHAAINSAGNVVTFPAEVQALKKLESAGLAAQTVGVTLLGPSRLWVALTGAGSPPNADMEVIVAVTGTNAAGTVVSETFTFDSDWRDNPAPDSEAAFDAETPTNYMKKVSATLFSTVTSWVVTGRANDGPNSAVVIVAMPTWNSRNVRDLAMIGAFQWNGLRVTSAMDLRFVGSTLEDLKAAQSASRVNSVPQSVVGKAYQLEADGDVDAGDTVYKKNTKDNRFVVAESFSRPRLHALRLIPVSNGTSYYAQLLDPDTGDFIDGFDPAGSRWTEGLSTLSFDYPSQSEAPTVYLSRAFSVGWQDTYEADRGPGKVRVRLVRSESALGNWSATAKQSIHGAPHQHAKVAVRWSSLGMNGDPGAEVEPWTAWLTLDNTFDDSGDDSDTLYPVDTWWLQTATPRLDPFRKFQFMVIGGNADGIFLEFSEAYESEQYATFEELVLDIDATNPGSVTVDTVRANSRFTGVTASVPFTSGDPLWFLEDATSGVDWNGLLKVYFQFDGESLSPDRYVVSVQAEQALGLYASVNTMYPVISNVRRLDPATDLYSGAGQINGANGTFVVYTQNIQADNVGWQAASVINRCRFVVTIRVSV